MDQDTHFTMFLFQASCKHDLEVDADLVERAIKVPVSIPDFTRLVLSHGDIVKETTGL